MTWPFKKHLIVTSLVLYRANRKYKGNPKNQHKPNYSHIWQAAKEEKLMAKILIVDDSAFLAKKIKTFVEGVGHEVIALAEDGIQAVEMYRLHQPDLVTLDITMPNKDGLDCLMEILDFDKDANAIIVSAIDDKKVIVDCLNLGAKGFIEKPLKFKDQEFCTKFNTALTNALH